MPDCFHLEHNTNDVCIHSFRVNVNDRYNLNR